MGVRFQVVVAGLLSFLLHLPVGAQALNASSLVHALLPSQISSNTSLVTGESLKLRPFTLTILTNDSHALVTANVSKSTGQIGWLGIGFGTKMADAAMVVLWPTDNDKGWVLSHRSAGGHSQPDFDPSVASDADQWTVDEATTTSTRSFSVVSFLRPLGLPKDQTLYPASRSTFLDLERQPSQKIIYAYSSDRPMSDFPSASLTIHDTRMFGSNSIDLSKVYMRQVTTVDGSGQDENGGSESEAPQGGTVDTDPSAASGSDEDDGFLESEWTKYDSLVFAHGGIAMGIWLLVSPVAVLVGRLGRGWFRWYTAHSSVQAFVTVPSTIVIVGLGFAAAANSDGGNSTSMSAHAILGFVVLGAVVLQAGLGFAAHKSPLSPVSGSTRPGPRVTHIVLGITVLILSWVQISLGLNEYQRRPRARVITVLFGLCIALFGALYLGSLALLTIARQREGRSLSQAIFGLGRPSASPTSKEPAWVVQLERIGREQEAGRSVGSQLHDRPPGLVKRDSWSARAATGTAL